MSIELGIIGSLEVKRMTDKADKAFRLLQMNERLSKGEAIFKDRAIAEFAIPSKTFQRDVDSLRFYYVERGDGELIYDRKANCYRLIAKPSKLTKEEIFAVCKVLIESRAFNREEFNDIIGKLLLLCEATEGKEVRSVIANEQVNYIPLQHGKPLVARLWALAECEKEQRVIEMTYKRADETVKSYDVKPVGIMFSEFYFYLIAFMGDGTKSFPTTFRVDRIVGFRPAEQKFEIPYSQRFSEAEFRKRVQFMYGGELRTVRFLYQGGLEAVLDRLPTARIEKQSEDGALIRAEAYGSGIDMWLKSQGEKVKIV